MSYYSVFGALSNSKHAKRYALEPPSEESMIFTNSIIVLSKGVLSESPRGLRCL